MNLSRIASVILLALFAMAPIVGAVTLQDAYAGGSSELLGMNVTWEGVVVNALVPYGVEPAGDLVRLNVTVVAVLIIDFDYNPETGYDYVVYPGYVLKGVDAVLAMRGSYNWSESAGGSTNFNYTLIYGDLLNWVPDYVDASSVVTGTINASGAFFKINWSGLAELYESASGRTTSPVFRAYLVAETPHSWWMNSSAGIVLEGEDYAACGPATVAGATIEFTGSPEDWPPSSKVCEDVSSQGVPGFLDFAAAYLSNDGNMVYIGFERAEALNIDYAYMDIFVDFYIDNDGDNTPDAGAHLAHFWIPDRERLSMSYRTGPRWNLVNAPIQEALLTTKVVEVSADASPAPPGMAADASIASSNVTMRSMILDVLDPGDGGTLIIDIVVDTVNKQIVPGIANYGVKVVDLPPSGGTPSVAEGDGARLLLPATAASVRVQVGMMGTPPMNAPHPNPGLGAELIGYYYFSVNDTNATGWPLKLYVEYNASTPPIVYYYDKADNAYKLYPKDLIVVHSKNKTLEIVFTEELYNRGDPGIIVYSAAPVIGGELVGSPPSNAPAIIVLVLVAAALLAPVIARSRQSRS